MKEWERWSRGDTDLLISFVRQGWSWHQVAKYLKRTEESCKRKYYRMGAGRRTLPRWTDEEAQFLEEEIRKGTTVPKLMAKTGRTRNSIIGRAWRQGLRIAG